MTNGIIPINPIKRRKCNLNLIIKKGSLSSLKF
jgi:hypothetical protein